MRRPIVMFYLLCSVIINSTNVLASEQTEDAGSTYWSGQFAGNIGLFAVGIGRTWQSKKVETDFLYGYVPASIAGEDVSAFALKTRRLLNAGAFAGNRVTPYLGIGLHYYLGEQYEVDGKYPDDYYPYSPWHLMPYMGIKLQPLNRGLRVASLNIEVGILDEFLIQYVNNRDSLSLYDVVSISFGISVPMH